MPVLIEIAGAKYTWDPAKSTPAWPRPVAEMPRVIKRLKAYNVETIIDFACGRGRHAAVFARNFKKVYLVEMETNIPVVRQLIQDHRFLNCAVIEAGAFQKAKFSAGACLLAFVLHTIPRHDLRLRVVRSIGFKLERDGIVVIITPAHDWKYSAQHIKTAQDYWDGIVRLYADGTFSFYRNYELEEIVEFVNEAGLEFRERVPGDHRYIVVASRRSGSRSSPHRN